MRIGVFSVGGSKEPIIYSIINNKINFPIFFCSKESYSDATDILKEIEKESILKKHMIYDVDDPQNINECYKKAKEIKNYLKKEIKDKDEIFIDITGGTKSMSSALFAAMLGENYKFLYIGSKNKRYDKKDVKSGEEKIFEFMDPIKELHENEKKLFEFFFNVYNYDAASAILEKIQILKKNEEDLYLGLKNLCYSYSLWDKFKISNESQRIEIKKNIATSKNKIETYYKYNTNEKICIDLEIIERNIQFLDQTFKDNSLIIVDLYYNALRRGEQSRYDDAIARLYATLEQLSHIQLKEKYKIDSSKLDINKLPDNLKEKYSKEKELALYKKYELLYDLNDDLGKKFKENEEELKKIINARNHSILAHGTNTLSKEQFEQFSKIIKNFINSDYEVIFPKIKFD